MGVVLCVGGWCHTCSAGLVHADEPTAVTVRRGPFRIIGHFLGLVAQFFQGSWDAVVLGDVDEQAGGDERVVGGSMRRQTFGKPFAQGEVLDQGAELVARQFGQQSADKSQVKDVQSVTLPGPSIRCLRLWRRYR
jgi:hypothetical protein